MEVQFTHRADGIIDATVSPGLDLFSHALVDAVSSRAPRGAHHEGLSTYWIDRTEDAVRRASIDGDSKPFASGNVTYLRLDGGSVVASYDFDPDEADAQSIALEQFLDLLSAWRQLVIDSGGVHGADAALIERDPPQPMGPVA